MNVAIRATRQVSVSARANQDTLRARRLMRSGEFSVGLTETVGPDRGAMLRLEHKVWWSRPSLWRHDATLPDGSTTVTLICESTSLRYMSAQNTVFFAAKASGTMPISSELLQRSILSEVQRLPLLPYVLADEEWNRQVEETSVRGRQAQRIQARRLGAADSNQHRTTREDDARPWIHADACEMVVDVESGILLSYAGRIADVVVETFVVDDLSFATVLPRDVFEFAPPPSVRWVHGCSF